MGEVTTFGATVCNLDQIYPEHHFFSIMHHLIIHRGETGFLFLFFCHSKSDASNLRHCANGRISVTSLL